MLTSEAGRAAWNMEVHSLQVSLTALAASVDRLCSKAWGRRLRKVWAWNSFATSAYSRETNGRE